MRGCRWYVPAADWVAVKKRLDPAKCRVTLELYHERRYIVMKIYRMMGIGHSTLYNYITEAKRNVRQQA